MKITLFPQRSDGVLTISLQGERLTISGDEVDLSVIPDGATLPIEAIDSTFIAGPIDRIDGELHVRLLLPRSSPFGVFDESGNMRPPITMNITCDGNIGLPVEPVEGVVNAH